MIILAEIENQKETKKQKLDITNIKKAENTDLQTYRHKTTKKYIPYYILQKALNIC